MIPLLDGVFRPERPALKAAREATLGIHDPKAAWEALHLAGLLPRAWLDEPRRRFPFFPHLPLHERAQQLRRAPFVPPSPFPDDVGACALIAADVAGIERAEACGSAFSAALAPWGIEPASAVLWVPTWPDHYDYQLHDTKPGVWEPDSMLWRAFPDARSEDLVKVKDRLFQEASTGATSARGSDLSHAVYTLLGWVYGDERWTAAARSGERIPRSAPPGVAGRLYADVPSPFAPALELFRTGYAPLPSGGGFLVLGYPCSEEP